MICHVQQEVPPLMCLIMLFRFWTNCNAPCQQRQLAGKLHWPVDKAPTAPIAATPRWGGRRVAPLCRVFTPCPPRWCRPIVQVNSCSLSLWSPDRVDSDELGIFVAFFSKPGSPAASSRISALARFPADRDGTSFLKTLRQVQEHVTSGLDIKVRTIGTGSAMPWQQQNWPNESTRNLWRLLFRRIRSFGVRCSLGHLSAFDHNSIGSCHVLVHDAMAQQFRDWK